MTSWPQFLSQEQSSPDIERWSSETAEGDSRSTNHITTFNPWTCSASGLVKSEGNGAKCEQIFISFSV